MPWMIKIRLTAVQNPARNGGSDGHLCPVKSAQTLPQGTRADSQGMVPLRHPHCRALCLHDSWAASIILGDLHASLSKNC